MRVYTRVGRNTAVGVGPFTWLVAMLFVIGFFAYVALAVAAVALVCGAAVGVWYFVKPHFDNWIDRRIARRKGMTVDQVKTAIARTEGKQPPAPVALGHRPAKPSRRCPACGAGLGPTAVGCPACGAALT